MYKNRTSNELMFDKLRDLTFELDVLAAYLRYSGNGNEKEARILSQCSVSIFDKVYKELRQSWIA